MHEDLYPLLNAYLDGELHGTRLREMELHLSSCEICQGELNELRRISIFLQAAPAPQFTPAERFVSNLTLSLPRRLQQAQPLKPASLWLVPAGSLGLWFFLRTVFELSNLIYMANESGVLGHAFPWFSNGSQETIWFALTTNLLGAHLTGNEHLALSLLNGINIFGSDLLWGLLWQAALIMFCLGWLAIWWMRRNPQFMKIENTH